MAIGPEMVSRYLHVHILGEGYFMLIERLFHHDHFGHGVLECVCVTVVFDTCIKMQQWVTQCVVSMQEICSR